MTTEVLRAKPARDGNGVGHLHFWCPGCDKVHGITYGPGGLWGWDGNVQRPTISGSVLVHPHETLNDAGERVMTPLCHSFVVDGRIQFLGDCTHDLANQTVDLPEWPYG